MKAPEALEVYEDTTPAAHPLCSAALWWISRRVTDAAVPTTADLPIWRSQLHELVLFWVVQANTIRWYINGITRPKYRTGEKMNENYKNKKAEKETQTSCSTQCGQRRC